jgi:hypothetical protein
MLLCADCHKLIDSKPKDFTRSMLEGFKAEHEARIRHLGSLSADVQTSVVQVSAKVGDHTVDIPVKDVAEAVQPRWPSAAPCIINLNAIGVESVEGAKAAAAELDGQVKHLYRAGGDVLKTRHISLFALAPIPLLMHLGSKLSNKFAIDFYQRHRDLGTTPWRWREQAATVDYDVRQLQNGTVKDRVALVISLSGTIPRDTLPASIDETFHVYELTLDGVTPNPDFLRSREDLDAFRRRYRLLLRELQRDHGQLEELHVFAAVPAPVAVCLGHDLLPKVDPALLAYDFNKLEGGFNLKLRITHDR